jgi:hypothetical protein
MGCYPVDVRGMESSREFKANRRNTMNREEFEQWYIENLSPQAEFEVDHDGNYVDSTEHVVFMAWHSRQTEIDDLKARQTGETL